jgi:hypothetical protein
MIEQNLKTINPLTSRISVRLKKISLLCMLLLLLAGTACAPTPRELPDPAAAPEETSALAAAVPEGADNAAEESTPAGQNDAEAEPSGTAEPAGQGTGESGETAGNLTPDAGSAAPPLTPEAPATLPALPADAQDAPETIKVSVRVDSAILPEGGELMPVTFVDLKPGESAWEALRLAAQTTGTPVAKSGSGASVYVKTIKSLSQFDHGAKSGWVFSVNGVFPSESCGAYKPADNDEIIFYYSLDLGRDVGGGGW